MKAEKLVLGNIVTLDPRNPIFQAMTVADGKVQYIGSLEMAKKLCDEHTEVLDYTGQYVYPGFIEAHCHGTLAGTRLAYYADLTPGTSMDGYVEIMRGFMAANPDRKFYYGAGWKELDKEPASEMLDAICPDKPMVLNSVDAHSLWMNHKGMEKYGIDEKAAKEWGTDIIRVKDDGTPTGYISEGPVNDILKAMNKMDIESKKKAALTWQNFALSQGITAYYEAGADEPYLDALSELISEGKWKLRVYCGYLMNENSKDYVADVRKAKAAAEKYNCEYLEIIGVKIFMDGVVEAHTAWMDEPYDDDPYYVGVKRFCDFDRVVALYVEAEKYDLNVHQHTIGDGAVKFALDCMEAAQIKNGNMHMRNALCHLQVVRKQDIKRLCELNAVAVVAPLWMSRADGAYAQSERYIGTKRTFYSYPMQSFLDCSGILAFHTDYPVSPAMNIPKSIYMACRRNEPKTEDFYQWNANECISREDAISGLTYGAAYSVKQEDHIGRLMIGFTANLSVFDTDFLHADLADVAEAKLIATVIDGNEVYRG